MGQAPRRYDRRLARGLGPVAASSTGPGMGVRAERARLAYRERADQAREANVVIPPIELLDTLAPEELTIVLQGAFQLVERQERLGACPAQRGLRAVQGLLTDAQLVASRFEVRRKPRLWVAKARITRRPLSVRTITAPFSHRSLSFG